MKLNSHEKCFLKMYMESANPREAYEQSFLIAYGVEAPRKGIKTAVVDMEKKLAKQILNLRQMQLKEFWLKLLEQINFKVAKIPAKIIKITATSKKLTLKQEYFAQNYFLIYHGRKAHELISGHNKPSNMCDATELKPVVSPRVRELEKLEKKYIWPLAINKVRNPIDSFVTNH